MQALFLLIYRYRAFLFFLLLEGICGWLIVSNNSYQGALFFNSSNAFVAWVNTTATSVSDYFSLAESNQSLANENAQLKQRLALLESTLRNNISDSVSISSEATQFEFFKAQIVNNSTQRMTNMITINKGAKHGVYKDMGIMGPEGIVGKVKDVSENFATVYSLLHVNLMTSVQLKSTGNFGTLQWDGVDQEYSKLLYVPRHVNVLVGDTVVTSGFNTIYPQGLTVGTVETVSITANDAFHSIRVKLAIDFDKISFVYCITNNKKKEQEELEKQSLE